MDQLPAQSRDRRSRSFYTLFLIEAWERFGYYSMASLLVLYMVQQAGFDDAQANLAWGAFTALVYSASAFGGWLGDNVLGTRRAVPVGAAVLTIGYGLLALASADVQRLYAAMAVIVIGNGLFKANAANMVRRIYEGDNTRLDAAFTLYYMAVNIGSTASILLAPWIKDRWGWNAAFAVGAAGLLLGLANFLWMARTLDGIGSDADRQPLRTSRLLRVLLGSVLCVVIVAFVIRHPAIARAFVQFAAVAVLAIFGWMITRGSSSERAGMVAALILVAESVLFFIFYQQMSTSLTLFALRNVDPAQTLFGIHLFIWSPGQYQALNAIWIMLLSPLLAWAYTALGERGRDLPIAAKFAIGFAAVAAGFFIFASSATGAIEGKVSSWYMIWGYGFYSLGELLVGALGLAMISRYIPLRMSGFMMGAYFIAIGVSQYLGSLVANIASLPQGIVDPMHSLTIYTGLFQKLGVLALFGMLVATSLVPLLRRLSARGANAG